MHNAWHMHGASCALSAKMYWPILGGALLMFYSLLCCSSAFFFTPHSLSPIFLPIIPLSKKRFHMTLTSLNFFSYVLHISFLLLACLYIAFFCLIAFSDFILHSSVCWHVFCMLSTCLVVLCILATYLLVLYCTLHSSACLFAYCVLLLACLNCAFLLPAFTVYCIFSACLPLYCILPTFLLV
jgi:hypothetical protein